MSHPHENTEVQISRLAANWSYSFVGDFSYAKIPSDVFIAFSEVDSDVIDSKFSNQTDPEVRIFCRMGARRTDERNGVLDLATIPNVKLHKFDLVSGDHKSAELKAGAKYLLFSFACLTLRQVHTGDMPNTKSRLRPSSSSRMII